jgi:hypothetical protein
MRLVVKQNHISLVHLIALFLEAEYWCEKACGCGKCGVTEISAYIVDDNGAYKEGWSE